jgi:DNA-binding IclR family transcriptional regulator
MAQESGESAFVGMLTGSGKIQYLAKAVSPKEVRYDASLAHLRPVHCTSMGLVILAHMADAQAARWLKPSSLVSVTPSTETDPEKIERLLRQARKDGYAEVRDANVEGASGVSAPIFGPGGDIMAGLNLGAPSFRYESARPDLIRIVCREAANITASLRAAVAATATA